MSTTHDDTTRTAMLAAIVPGFTPAALDICNSAGTVLVSFANPAYTNSGLQIALNSSVTANGSNAGDAHHAILRNSGSTRWQRYSDLRNTSGGDVQLDSLTIASSQPCTLISHTIAAPL